MNGQPRKGKILAIKSKSHMIDPGINKLRDEVRNTQIQTKREMDPRPVVSIYIYIYIYIYISNLSHACTDLFLSLC